MKESRQANFGAIQAIFLQLSWSQHKLAHSCQGRRQRSNGATNRNKHFYRSFCRGISFGYSLSNRGKGGEGEGEREGGQKLRVKQNVSPSSGDT